MRKKHTNKIKKFISSITFHSTLIADPEFDVEENYRIADKYRINLHVK